MPVEQPVINIVFDKFIWLMSTQEYE